MPPHSLCTYTANISCSPVHAVLVPPLTCPHCCDPCSNAHPFARTSSWYSYGCRPYSNPSHKHATIVARLATSAESATSIMMSTTWHWMSKTSLSNGLGPTTMLLWLLLQQSQWLRQVSEELPLTYLPLDPFLIVYFLFPFSLLSIPTPSIFTGSISSDCDSYGHHHMM
jgi:hypothetical protein